VHFVGGEEVDSSQFSARCMLGMVALCAILAVPRTPHLIFLISVPSFDTLSKPEKCGEVLFEF